MTGFKHEIECTYKNERYLVRDNGQVLRQARMDKRLRKYDNQWTFGKPNNKTGYMEISATRIHRIVATAFHGDPPTKEHVVDHIDTNRQNNRIDNLRWVTKLENILLNPITVKRIELACECSIDEFLDDPSKFRNKFRESNYNWMSLVSKEEAQISKKKLLDWSKSNKLQNGGSLGEWVYSRGVEKQSVDRESEYTESINSNAIQKYWKTPSEFPLCPLQNMNNSINTYEANLNKGEIFSCNQYLISIIYSYGISKDKNALLVMCSNSDENAVKPWLLIEVTYKNGIYVHNNLGSFFHKDGAEKHYAISKGIEWKGGDVFDDFTN
jgi:hypothetical protein